MSIEMQTEERAAKTERAWRTSGKGAARRAHGVHVLRLEGSFAEMGEQHGALLAREIAEGPIPYYRAHFQKLVGRSSLGPLSPLVWRTLQTLVGRRVQKNVPEFARQTLAGLARGAGMDERAILDGATMPDALLWLAARVMDARDPGPAVSHRLALGLGCTSAVAWGGATRDGKLLHARNFDYHGVGCWPSSAAVIFHRPDGGLRYVSVAAAGVPMGGITAMNEAGLSLTVHQHMFTDRARLGGTPIGTVGDIVMREAQSLDDAEQILAAHRPIGCWTYVVTDAKRREVLSWEENPDRQVAKRMSREETFGYANVYLDPALGATEVNMYGSYWRHNQARHARANELLAARRGALDAQAMADILADPGRGECRISEAIAMVMTVGSVVFSPEDGVVWVGIGPGRGNRAPTSGGAFVPFSLRAQDVDEGTRELSTETRESPEAREAYEHYRRAYVLYLDRHDVKAARDEMVAAVALAPREALYHFLVGLTSLELGEGAAARAALDRALALGHAHEQRRAAFHHWRGRASAVRGGDEGAQQHWRWSLGLRADAPVHAAARRDLRRGFTRERAAKISVDFSMADVAMP